MKAPTLSVPSGWTRLSQEERNRFIALYNSGARIADIAAELRLSRSMTCVVRDALRLPKRNSQVTIPVGKVLYSYTTLNMSLTDIAEACKVSRTSIARILKSKGIQIRPNKKEVACADRRAEIFRRYQSGEMIVSIAKSLGLSTKTIRRRILDVLQSRA